MADLQSVVSQATGQHTITTTDRHALVAVPTSITDRNRLGISDHSGVNLDLNLNLKERLVQERVAHRALQEQRAIQERALYERAVQERALQNSVAVQNRAVLHQTLIIPSSAHIISTHERVIEKSSSAGSGVTTVTSVPASAIQQNNVASPDPV